MPTAQKKTEDVAVKKTTKKKVAAAEATEETATAVEMKAAESVKGGSFIGALGRRKTSVARVRLIKNGKGTITVNGREMTKYFTTFDLREQVTGPLKTVGQEAELDVSASVDGGGIRGQAEAVRLGISRALIELNPTYRTALKKLGYLTRDPRERERKKFGKQFLFGVNYKF